MAVRIYLDAQDPVTPLASAKLVNKGSRPPGIQVEISQNFIRRKIAKFREAIAERVADSAAGCNRGFSYNRL